MLKHVNPLKIIELVGNALMEKDTTRETAKKLESMDYPHLRDLLPHRDYDGDHQLFINQHSLGFLLEAQPLIGANEKLVESLEELVKNNLLIGREIFKRETCDKCGSTWDKLDLSGTGNGN